MRLSKTIEKTFNEEIANKYHIYNSFFVSLPYKHVNNVGVLLPILHQLCKEGLKESKSPMEIVGEFFEKHAHLYDESKQIDFLFAVIQYVERQVVLFDSVEDAAFPSIHKHLSLGTLASMYNFSKHTDIRRKVKDKIKNTKVKIVFTAHPTQFYPNDVLRLITDIQNAVREGTIGRINTLLRQLGSTPFFNKKKPTPLEEARSIMYYLRYVNYETIKILHNQAVEYFLDAREDFSPIVSLGFWPGGDRDGNPFVTAAITKSVVDELRYDILSCYYTELKAMSRRLTFAGVKEKIGQLRQAVYDNLYNDKSDLTEQHLIEHLEAIRQQIINEYGGLFVEMVDTFIRQIKTFGMYFGSLDIRQDSRIHEHVLDSILKKYVDANQSYLALSDKEREAFLFETPICAKEEDFDEPIIKDTLANIKQLKDIQAKNGEKAIHRYIISNSISKWHILEVLGLFRLCGYTHEQIKFDIIPLFETVEGLTQSDGIMQQLYTHPVYTKHLQEVRHKKQTIMLGFSDGTKDAGYMRANWEIYKNKEKLTAISQAYGVDVIFFDGRGGPPGRGGGKTHQFYASQSSKIASHEIQVTIQGQTISSQYGSVDQALYNMEQLVTASIMSGLNINANAELSDEGRELIERLSDISYQKYVTLKEHPLFISYLEKFSVLRYFGDTNIGSRPSKRSGGQQAKLQLSDLRAIPFVGSWSQIKQNIPGFYGLGTAIETLKQEGKLHQLQHLFQESLYFKTLMQNSMMALAKTLFTLTAYISKDEEYGDFWKLLHHEYTLAVENLLLISKQTKLMETEVINRLSIDYRENIVLPLLVIQQYALQKNNEEKNDFHALYQKLVVRAIFGNTNASRNSA